MSYIKKSKTTTTLMLPSSIHLNVLRSTELDNQIAEELSHLILTYMRENDMSFDDAYDQAFKDIFGSIEDIVL